MDRKSRITNSYVHSMSYDSHCPLFELKFPFQSPARRLGGGLAEADSPLGWLYWAGTRPEYSAHLVMHGASTASNPLIHTSAPVMNIKSC